MIRLVAALVLLIPATASAAERTIGIGSFDRIRVEGPFEVQVATGRSPHALVSGDRRAIDDVEVRIDGTTLVVRRDGNGWGEQREGASETPLAITLGTPNLVAASVFGAGRITIGRMKAPRIDLSVSGTGTIALTTADTDQANVTVLGSGSIALGGRASRARLLTNGAGGIDAQLLDVGDLTVRLDGPGETKAKARYTAQVVNTGLGRVAIDGNCRCIVKALAGGPVSCGPKL